MGVLEGLGSRDWLAMLPGKARGFGEGNACLSGWTKLDLIVLVVDFDDSLAKHKAV